VAGSVKFAVAIPTRGRAAILAQTIAFLAVQERQPDSIVIAYAEPADIADAPVQFPHVTFIQTPLGLTRQRNALLQECRAADLVLFIDDDFYLHPEYLAITEQVFRGHPDIAGSTGAVIADDIKGPGLTVAQAKAILSASNGAQAPQQLIPTSFAYGCNMCLRMARLSEHDLRFDESLPLYGWYEDWDFSARLAAVGSVVLISNACGVHLSVKMGRISGVRMGYAQVANPIYLARKGTFLWSNVFRFIVGPFFKNFVRSFTSEPYIDRFGRFRGNLKAFADLLSGRLRPGRIVEL
jgi:glycosyltransferase involved in cell wall biosynthesis